MSATFHGPVPEQPREDVLAAYLQFLGQRNGSTATAGAYPEREKWLAGADANPVRHRGELGGVVQQALQAFVKVNAAEAYGVEVISRRRHARPFSGIFEQVERVLGNEETYHTRILLGATRQFGLTPPSAAFRPPLPLRILIGTMAYSPKALFHPVLL